MVNEPACVEKLDDGYYLVVRVEIHTAMKCGEIKKVRTEAKRARIIADGVGFDPKTQQRITRDGKHYYTFRAKNTKTDNFRR